MLVVDYQQLPSSNFLVGLFLPVRIYKLCMFKLVWGHVHNINVHRSRYGGRGIFDHLEIVTAVYNKNYHTRVKKKSQKGCSDSLYCLISFLIVAVHFKSKQSNLMGWGVIIFQKILFQIPLVLQVTSFSFRMYSWQSLWLTPRHKCTFLGKRFASSNADLHQDL